MGDGGELNVLQTWPGSFPISGHIQLAWKLSEFENPIGTFFLQFLTVSKGFVSMESGSTSARGDPPSSHAETCMYTRNIPRPQRVHTSLETSHSIAASWLGSEKEGWGWILLDCRLWGITASKKLLQVTRAIWLTCTNATSSCTLIKSSYWESRVAMGIRAIHH